MNALELDVTGELDTHGFLGLSDDVRPGYQNITICGRVDADAPSDALQELWQHAQPISPVLDIVRTPVSISLVLHKR